MCIAFCLPPAGAQGVAFTETDPGPLPPSEFSERHERASGCVCTSQSLPEGLTAGGGADVAGTGHWESHQGMYIPDSNSF